VNATNGRPGLARGRARGLVSIRWTPLARGSDGLWKALFEAADVVSEGAVVCEGLGQTWYGSTSLILALPTETSDSERAFIAEVAARDLHVRLRSVRLALREAQLRAPTTLGRSSCEMRVGWEARGVRIDVEVQAPLIEGSLLGATGQER
jgi:hypothetical protein